jgi:phosphopantothenate-cysteine ligase
LETLSQEPRTIGRAARTLSEQSIDLSIPCLWLCLPDSWVKLLFTCCYIQKTATEHPESSLWLHSLETAWIEGSVSSSSNSGVVLLREVVEPVTFSRGLYDFGLSRLVVRLFEAEHSEAICPASCHQLSISTLAFPSKNHQELHFAAVVNIMAQTATVSGSDPATAEHDYFASNPAPKILPQHLALARAFIQQHSEAGRKVALVTSGGTTVPLENQTVRYIDNFSAGTRGATSAEYFMEAGYAVIFLHRQFSLLPYSRHYSHSTRSFLDFMREDENGRVVVDEEHQEEMLRVLRQYAHVNNNNLLLTLTFVTITEYLWELRELAKLMQPLGSRGLFYLAAAVSDFFVPQDRMVEHKIQSSEAFSQRNESDSKDANSKPQAARTEGSSLIIDLDPVPKFLKQLVDVWAPEAMIVSFKLETDPSILVEKAKYSLNKYSHNLVIGNLLTTRKWEVVFVSKGSVQWIRVPRGRRTKSISGIEAQVGKAGGDQDASDVNAHRFFGEPAVEIESLIIPSVTAFHEKMASQSIKNISSN